MNTRPPQPDHLVIAATTLEEGVAWCEATLGVTPGPGGEHALFGTHNRLLKLDCDGAPNAYLEIIAINPAATPQRGAPCRRWFDLDDHALRSTLATQGPQLVHWVASVPSLSIALAACRAQGIERGELILHLQPQIDIATCKIIGAEALVRWQNPELGLVSPAKFIPVAEETGFTVDVNSAREVEIRTTPEDLAVGRTDSKQVLPSLKHAD